MNPRPEPKAIATELCRILGERFPDLEIQHSDPEVFFDGYFSEGGFPDHTNHFPVWAEPGQVVWLEEPGLHPWDPANLCFQDPVPGRHDRLLLFIHGDGYTALVDPETGGLFELFPTPETETLAEVLKLFFAKGREDLGKRAHGTAAAIGVHVPYFRFPDDVSRDFCQMPVVPVELVRERLQEHVKYHLPWLGYLQNRDSFVVPNATPPTTEKKATARIPDHWIQHFSKIADAFEAEQSKTRSAEPSIVPPSGEKMRRQLIEASQKIAAEEFVSDWNGPHASKLPLSYAHFGGFYFSPELPVVVLYTDQVFAPIIDRHYYPAAARQILKATIDHLKDGGPGRFPQSIDLPPYPEQVEDYFIQSVLIHQTPILAQQAVRLEKTVGEAGESHLERRRAIWTGIRRLLPK